MSKKIEINGCNECPKLIGTHCGFDDNLIQIESFPLFPKWCPIPDEPVAGSIYEAFFKKLISSRSRNS